MTVLPDPFRRIFSIILTGWLLLSSVSAESGETAWKPPTPKMDDEFDWIELTSGEWLKGEFRSMYNESVEFDSDKLGVLTIDWDDINEIHFANQMGVRTENRAVVEGKVSMVDGRMTFGDGVQTLERKQVVAIAPLADNEWDRWSFNALIGADFQRGNTDETRYTSSLSATRKTESTRLNLSYLGNYTITDSIETTNNHRVKANFDYFFDERMYFRFVDIQYYRDPFQNIDLELTAGAGVGYRIFDTKTVDWEVFAGPAYQYTEFSSVEPGQRQSSQSPAFVFSSTFDYEITSDLDFKNSYQLILTNAGSGLLTQHLVSKLEYEVTTIFDVFVMLQFDRVEEPTPRSDGTIPAQDDVTLSFGLGLDI
ncbi:MAG: DUF481 domain-containing protein [Verrucomicrobiota bacterium]